MNFKPQTWRQRTSHVTSWRLLFAGDAEEPLMAYPQPCLHDDALKKKKNRKSPEDEVNLSFRTTP